MLTRRGKGKHPQIVFTSDFHQLVRGDRLPGKCVLRYDPYRIVPPNEVSSLPATQRPIVACVRFHPSGQLWAGDLRFAPASRIVPDWDPTGHGTAIECTYDIPEGVDELECWFSYNDNSGQTLWDSAMGNNYWLRFPTLDLDIPTAEIVAQPKEPTDLLKLEVVSIPTVQTVRVRWRYTTDIAGARQQHPLTPSSEGNSKHWTLPHEVSQVASNTPLAFDLVYTAGGHEFTDDNEGSWYVLSRS